MQNRQILILCIIAILAVALLAMNAYAVKPDKPPGKPDGGGGGRSKAIADVDIIIPLDGWEFIEGDYFLTTARVTCLNKACHGVEVSITLPSGLSLNNNSEQYIIGDMAKGTTIDKSWVVSANTMGSYQISVTTIGTKRTQGDTDSVGISVIEQPGNFTAS
jgi:hypothetical protein